MNQTTIFDILYSKKKITKPIRLIELFSGYGSQALALKYLGVPFEHWKTCEWAVKSIQAYKDIHFTDDNEDYSILNNLSYEKLIDILYNYGISQNYNEPMTLEQIKRLGEKQIRKIFNNIVATHNLVNIQKVKGYNLEITDTNKYEYIMTYSFPCQDLSLAGKGKGMSDKSTRSGMLWEVERILTECYELGEMPQILLMENVPQVHSEDNVEDFNKWKDRLEELGYKNYFQDLIATDYGIPQTRNRCFMISILGDYSYTFPKPIPLKLKLKDMLEDNIDKKYYLSDKMIDCFINPSDSGKKFGRDKQFLRNLNNNEIAQTITTCAGNRATDNFIKIKNATTKGYLEATDGDEIDISSRMEYHRGNVQKDKIQTLTTSGGNDRGVCVKGIATNENKSLKIDSIYKGEKAKSQGGSIYNKENSSPTLSTGHGYAVPLINNELKIRKLTPRECFRLMGVKDEDFDKVKVNQSDSSLYHLAGDSIVVNVLMAIFKELL